MSIIFYFSIYLGERFAIGEAHNGNKQTFLYSNGHAYMNMVVDADAVVEEYLRRVDAGEAVDKDAFLAHAVARRLDARADAT